MSGHTPTPWETRAVHVFCAAGNVCTVGEPCASKFVGYTELELGSAHAGEAFANAALVVKAVNNHDALVTELQRLFELYGHQATADVLRRVGLQREPL